MAQVKLLKIDATGLPIEMDTSTDDITLQSYTVTGGGPVLNATGLDLNNGTISDADDLSFTDPTTDGITRTDGTHAADDILMQDAENIMASGASILFPTVTDTADQLDALRVPALAGAPSATPADGGTGYLIWDSTNKDLYAWDGTTWDNLNIVEDAERISNLYTAAEALSTGEVLYISAADTVAKADVSTSGNTDYIIGMAASSAAMSSQVKVASEGVVPGLTGLTAGSRYFVDNATPGGITSSIPTGAGNRIIQVGYAKSSTEMHLQIAFIGRRS